MGGEGGLDGFGGARGGEGTPGGEGGEGGEVGGSGGVGGKGGTSGDSGGMGGGESGDDRGDSDCETRRHTCSLLRVLLSDAAACRCVACSARAAKIWRVNIMPQTLKFTDSYGRLFLRLF